MPKLKSHLSVQQIAKKHRMDVSDIQKQLDMGQPIEHEHTKDHTLAMDIALQHLDEIPDYYTRLKKMEASAKKEHKKFKDVKESNEEQRYCPLCDKREGRSECSYGEKAWDKVSVRDHEYSMVRSELDTLVRAAERIKKKVGKGEGSLEAWVQSKITKAADYIDTAADYLGSDEKIDEGSQISFNVDPQKLKADKKASKIRTLAQQGATEGEREAAKNKTTGPSLAKGSLSTGVINAEYEPSLVEKILKELEEEKNPGLWTAIRNRRDKGLPRKKPGQKGYPKTLDIDEDLAQARKNVGASKCWKNKKIGNPPTKIKGGKEVPNCESVTIEDANGNLYAEVVDLIKPEPIKGFKQQVSETTRLQSETGNIIAVILNWRGKTYSIRMFFPQSGMPSKKDVTIEIQKVYPGAQVLQYNVSTLQPGMPLIQVVNSKSKNYLLNNKTIGEESIEEVAAWQRKEGKSQSGGLNEKGRKSYERENPGSNLQRPQPEGGSRRDSFCARMKGMKRKLTSAKTANDPDSRINKSLRAWNC